MAAQKREYAEFFWGGDGWANTRGVFFSHRENLTKVKGDAFWSVMRQLGSEGWELVSTARASPSAPTSAVTLYFKRQLD